MLRVVTVRNKRHYLRELDQYHKLRKLLFIDIYGWEIPADGDREIDEYDKLDQIIYILCLNSDGRKLIGGIRMLPTTGLNMLNDEAAFSELLPDGQPIRSPKIWELSRFAVNPRLDTRLGKERVSLGVAELGIGVSIVGRWLGIDQTVTVYDLALHKRLERWGIAGVPICEPKQIGKVKALAAVYEADTEAQIKAISGLAEVDLRSD
jgi:acyl homoserine lactone synthase